MATAVLKRKNIDLPIDTLNKLSILASSKGKSLKRYIESILISKANSVSIQISENPSPSGDEWFDIPENVAELNKGIRQMKDGNTREISDEELNAIPGI